MGHQKMVELRSFGIVPKSRSTLLAQVTLHVRRKYCQWRQLAKRKGSFLSQVHHTHTRSSPEMKENKRINHRKMFSLLARSFPSLIKPYQRRSERTEAGRRVRRQQRTRTRSLPLQLWSSEHPPQPPRPLVTSVDWIKRRQQPKGMVLNNARAQWVH